jgi:hypothetical protein
MDIQSELGSCEKLHWPKHVVDVDKLGRFDNIAVL